MAEAVNANGLRRLDAQYIGMLDYAQAWELQKAYVKQIDQGERDQSLLLLQHPPTYTMGSDKHPEHLLLDEEQLKERGITLFQIDRGGDITYHGPGQLVGYPLLYLDAEGLNLHGYLRSLEQVIINWLKEYGIEAGRKSEYTGVWVGHSKIAAIGVKFNRARHQRGFITSHGFALNIKSGIAEEGFSGIVPCGIQQFGVTSFNDLTGLEMSVEEAAKQLLPHFIEEFKCEPILVEE
ncbi:lipoyl(octanoyl) transferase LipB [Paenibacillus sinopodophylli]|uniref:lipoyl(octanoyl) transferase LipB n=1 Tax=Paenibacillus sinopodophylli TaxID=1837342 RepID=UPI00110D0784|nr:lipoyl(octanoyl) transferase LipB [Paenibacillus sinopodophylli]